jgi:hypothetical protein
MRFVSTLLRDPVSHGGSFNDDAPLCRTEIASVVEAELDSTPFVDIHTHLFMPSLGSLGLWGIDELITYHYLEAEVFRSSDLSPEQYWNLSKRERADVIWRALFVENAPVSEATRGVVAVMTAFGLDASATDLSEARSFFEQQELSAHIDRVFEIGGISEAVMTNDPVHPEESRLWLENAERDSRFHSVLRLDGALKQHQEPRELRTFLAAWMRRMQPVYMAVSLPDTFRFPEESLRSKLIAEAVLPVCYEFEVPLSLMIGVKYQVNPRLRLAGDGAGRADLSCIEHLCSSYPDNRFLVSVLSRENQHELCVYARKFNNLMPFGCWWFLNNPSIVEEITRERLEMLGTSFVPQHSDARVLEQVIYKWRNTRRTIAPILANAYTLLADDGRAVKRSEIRRDITRMFRGNFERFCKR